MNEVTIQRINQIALSDCTGARWTEILPSYILWENLRRSRTVPQIRYFPKQTSHIPLSDTTNYYSSHPHHFQVLKLSEEPLYFLFKKKLNLLIQHSFKIFMRLSTWCWYCGATSGTLASLMPFLIAPSLILVYYSFYCLVYKIVSLFRSLFGRKKIWKSCVSDLQQASFRLLRIFHLFQLMGSEERYLYLYIGLSSSASVNYSGRIWLVKIE